MRLHFKISPNKQKIDFDYQHKLTGVFHRWMGLNEIHSDISLYSMGWLRGKTVTNGGLDFPEGASWFLSAWNNDLIKRIIDSAISEPDFICGMRVTELTLQPTPNFGKKERFYVSGPVFIRRYTDDSAVHLTYLDDDADRFLTDTMSHKLRQAGMNSKISVKFDRSYHNSKTKLVSINGIKNKASLCPVILEGDEEAIRFAWNVGAGHLTGCGFGGLI